MSRVAAVATTTHYAVASQTEGGGGGGERGGGQRSELTCTWNAHEHTLVIQQARNSNDLESGCFILVFTFCAWGS